MKLKVFVLILVTAAAAQADEISLCSNGAINLRTAPIGFRCLTSGRGNLIKKGVVFVRVARDGFGEAWKDEDSGMIWGDVVGEYSHYDALRVCKPFGAILATAYDYARGDFIKFAEVLPNMRNREEWTSSVHDEFAGYAHVKTRDGYPYAFLPRDRVLAVRCIQQF